MTEYIKTYKEAKQFMNNSLPIPNYIPVKNYQDFTADVYLYYNQYCASPAVTQQRRIMRNYINNNNTIKQSNKNPFINKNIKYNFAYGQKNTYMIIQLPNNIVQIYLYNGSCSCWCLQKELKNTNCIKQSFT